MKGITSLSSIHRSPDISVYEIVPPFDKSLRRYVVSSAETRRICNDPFCLGVEYTTKLRAAVAKTVRILWPHLPLAVEEFGTVVLNLLRGGLNFSLREALNEALEWNCHASAFLTAQRVRDDKDGREWHITEHSYQKIMLPSRATLIMGDVVATGTSLRFALTEILNHTARQGKAIANIIFFTIGSTRSEYLLREVHERCKGLFPGYEGACVIYFEGRFTVLDDWKGRTPVITGTDLLRTNCVLAPEFFESQYDNPLFPLERCTIYDAGSRAFWIPEYVEDVVHYWKAIESLNIPFLGALEERFPELDPSRFSKVDLKTLAAKQVAKGLYYLHD